VTALSVTVTPLYKNIVPLNEKRHADLSVEMADDYSYFSATNATYLSLVEFAKASREYPIVFAGVDDKIFPMAILGLESNQNLYLNKRARWVAEYIPAYVRRYPFILAEDKGALTVCIDESFKGFNTDSKGKRLFDGDGRQSKYLKQMMGFLKQFQEEYQRTITFVKRLSEFDLLEPMHANVELNSGVKLSLTGFFVVSRQKLKSLDADKIEILIKTDEMEMIYTHLISLGVFDRLMEKFAAIDKAC
jgi:hypothetical protein